MTTTPRPAGPRLRVEIDQTTDGLRDRQAVLLLNSIGTTRRLWDGIVDSLVAAGRRVVRYDARGHGGSSAPRGPCRLEDLADDAVRVLDSLDVDRADVVGISLGGQTALSLALDHPGRVGRVVVADTGAKIGTADSWAARAASVRDGGLGSIADGVLAGWLTPAYAAEHPDLVATMRGWFLDNDPAGYAEVCGALGAADLRPRLAHVAAPTLVLGASDDVATPPTLTRQIADGIPAARYLEIPGAHLSVLESPREFLAALLEHLDRA